MSWEDYYIKFSAFFNQFERDLLKKDLTKTEEQSLVDNLNQVVEWGWKALQDYDLDAKRLMQSEPSATGSFSGNHALLRLKELFENKIQIKSAHDIKYLRENEWEVREVIHPAFKELDKFFESFK